MHLRRPLAFYLGIEAMFLLKHCLMLAMGFRGHSLGQYNYYVLEPTAVSAASQQEGGGWREGSPAVEGTEQPIMFMHGIGVWAI